VHLKENMFVEGGGICAWTLLFGWGKRRRRPTLGKRDVGCLEGGGAALVNHNGIKGNLKRVWHKETPPLSANRKETKEWLRTIP